MSDAGAPHEVCMTCAPSCARARALKGREGKGREGKGGCGDKHHVVQLGNARGSHDAMMAYGRLIGA